MHAWMSDCLRVLPLNCLPACLPIFLFQVDILGLVVNQVPSYDHAILTSQMRRMFRESGVHFAGSIPKDNLLEAGVCCVGGGVGSMCLLKCQQNMVHSFHDDASAFDRIKPVLG